MDSLEQRREKFCLEFAKATQNIRCTCVKRAKTERLKRSAIISMKKLLNNEASKNKEVMAKISNYVPVNYDCMQSLSLRN